jgi:hypothetical protein
MAPVTRVVEIYRPETTEGNTLAVLAGGQCGINWGDVANPTSSVGLSSTTVGTTTNLTNGVNVTQWSGSAVASVDAAGYPVVTIKDGTGQGELNLDTGRTDANVTYWSGSAVAAVDTAGHPVVTIKEGTGAGELDLTSGLVNLQASQSGVTIGTVTDITNDVNLNMGQTTPGSPTPDTTGEALRFAHENLDVVLSTRSSHAPTAIVSAGAITTSGGAVSSVTTVGTVTNEVDADVTAVSGSSGAADALELLALNCKGTDHKVLISADAQDLSATLEVQTSAFDSALDFTTAMDAAINAEVVDVIRTDQPASDLADAVPSNVNACGLEEKINYMYGALIYALHVDSDSIDYYNASAVNIWSKALTDDGTDYDEAKGAS